AEKAEPTNLRADERGGGLDNHPRPQCARGCRGRQTRPDQRAEEVNIANCRNPTSQPRTPSRKSSIADLSPRLLVSHRCFMSLFWSFTRFNRKVEFSLFIVHIVTTSCVVIT